MKWTNLLNGKRVRDLYDARPSSRAENEMRTEFERDYGRVVFSTPVRRLQDKAQVFPLEPNDAVRTRLTHSMEVSSVARGIADAICRALIERNHINSQQASSISTIAATCGLIHDIGNPPFGHAGEVAIADWFKNRLKTDSDIQERFNRMTGNDDEHRYAQDFLRFDGNPQTLRLLSRLQIISDEYGLNLTCGTLSAACKYIPSSAKVRPDGNKAFRKPGHFSSESGLIHKVRKETGTGKARNPIAYIVEAADDIVYATVDIEDGVKKGVLSWERCRELLQKELKPAPESEDHACRGAEAILKSVLHKTSEKVDRGQWKPIGKDWQDASAAMFRTFAINEVVPEVVKGFMENYDRIMNGTFKKDLIESRPSAERFIKACKGIARVHVFPTEPVLKLEHLGREVIHSLMDAFWEGAGKYEEKMPPGSFNAKVYNLFSQNYRNIFENSLKRLRENADKSLPGDYARFQLVTDYICGMTDTFAITLHRQLKNGT